MRFNRLFCGFIAIIFFVFALPIGSTAARTGEFETYDVAFRAFVPGDVVEPVHVQLKHKTEDYVLTYTLLAMNDYFINEPVYPGEYSVSVSVDGRNPDEFYFMYDKVFVVEPSAVAVPFNIIIDNVSLEGDAPALPITPTPETETDSLPPENSDAALPTDGAQKNDGFDAVETPQEDLSATDETTSIEQGKGRKSLLFSFLFSCSLIAVVTFVLWQIKKRG